MLTALLVAFGTVFVAEMADKTQLASIALATRYRLASMFAGLAIGSVVVMGVSAGIGAVAGAALPTKAIGIGAGAVFVAVGIWMLAGAFRSRPREAESSEGSSGDRDEPGSSPEPDLVGEASEAPAAPAAERRSGIRPIMIVAGTFIAAELGDKTMVAAITLASKGSAVAVWAGGAVALFAVDAIAAALGDVLSRILSPKVIGPVAGGLFLAAGGWMLWDSLVG